MFGESESESPRVPSPWDSLMSPSPAPKSRGHTPSPLTAELATVPRLVAESDDGNVEYKLQLLNPTPARFARLVTQLKWRLLEGGGQAYYELGVADSGDLVGLSREDLEQSLETLEMMAGEIGASIIVVKEIEVPAALARIAKRSGDNRRIQNDEDDYSSSALSSFSNSDVDSSDGGDGLSCTVVLDKEGSPELYPPAFAMDPDSDNGSASASWFAIDLEISSVFKPRPVRTKHSIQSHLLVSGKNKRNYKAKKHVPGPVDDDRRIDAKQLKAQNRRHARDKKREGKKRTLMELAAAQSIRENEIPISAPIPLSVEPEHISSTLEGLELEDFDTPTPLDAIVADSDPFISVVEEENSFDDDVFPTISKHQPPAYAKFPAVGMTESHLDVDPTAVQLADAMTSGSPSDHGDLPRLIVEVLVVRKMSLSEGFLDFGGFSII